MMKEVYDFLKEAGVYYLATAEGSQPRVRPFGTVDIFEDKLYIQTGKSKAVAKQIFANPKIEISAMDSQKRWIRLTGEAVEDNRVEVKKHMLDAYPQLRDRYSENDDNTLVLYLKNAVASIESFSGEKKVIKF
jgi:uncharacterized pyridoxamine 5'-phosphate oxidase family protein